MSSRAWMGADVRRSQPSRLDASVNLSGGDRCMSQQLLDRTQVGAPLEQVGRKRVAERVRVGTGECGLTGPGTQTAPDVGRREATAGLRQEQPAFARRERGTSS